MIRYECFEWLAPLLTDQLVVTSLSGQRVEWGHLSKREADLNLGSMGNALAVGIGLALALPNRKVFVFESDGSVLLSLFNLPTLFSGYSIYWGINSVHDWPMWGSLASGA